MHNVYKLCLSALIGLTLTACDPTVETRGAVKDPEWKEQIKAGETTRDEVTTLLGTPSTTSSFGQETWYYITSRRENYGFMKPKIAAQNVLRLTFDASGVVASIEELDETKMREVEVTERVTPTEGHQMTFFEQLVGNVGRFNTPNDSAIAPGSNRPGGR